MTTPDLIQTVCRLATAFERCGARHALIGGLAVGLRARPCGELRSGFVLDVQPTEFAGLLADLAADGFDIDEPAVARQWSEDRYVAFYRRHQLVELVRPALPLYQRVLETATVRTWLGGTLRVATTEGLILTKLLAFRPQDQVDIETLLAVNRDALDLSVVRDEWAAFADKEPERTGWFAAAVARLVPG